MTPPSLTLLPGDHQPADDVAWSMIVQTTRDALLITGLSDLTRKRIERFRNDAEQETRRQIGPRRPRGAA